MNNEELAQFLCRIGDCKTCPFSVEDIDKAIWYLQRLRKEVQKDARN